MFTKTQRFMLQIMHMLSGNSIQLWSEHGAVGRAWLPAPVHTVNTVNIQPDTRNYKIGSLAFCNSIRQYS